MAAEDEGAPPARSGGTGLGKKLGPFPLGVWAVIGGGLVGVVWFLRRNSAAAAANSSATPQPTGATGDGTNVPTSLVPINEGLSEQQYKHLKDAIEDMNGEPSEPDHDHDRDHDHDHDRDDRKPKPKPKPPAPKPKPPAPKPKPKPQPRTVTVAKWTRGHTPWNSTLWGIAQKEHIKGGYQYLAKINHIKNPNLIYPGQKIKL